MSILTDEQRRRLDRTVQRARGLAHVCAREALSHLAVDREDRPDYLADDGHTLRIALREKAKLLGDSTGPETDLRLLIEDVAYAQWHRLLFARFLEVNGLLRHPDVPDVALTLDDCHELASEEDEPDGWSGAARYAEAILPGVFRASDPAVRLRFAPERRAELDAIVAELDKDTLTAEDALGWVYQFWQTAEKKQVNDSERKIGGADLAPVTQLFTEDYMVRFLLENSLGAWWSGRHPDSPLLAEWEYLRRLDDGTPAAGSFDRWPSTAAEITVLDPCCGSGHFLVAAFGMLWRMRAEEEGLTPAQAQNAALRDNLFGLELDSRCTQIALFNVVLEAWKQGGLRQLPAVQIACSGTTVTATRQEWEREVEDIPQLIPAMAELHRLFHDADSLGSLIDPRLDPGDALLSRYGTSEESGLLAGSVLQLLQGQGQHNSVTGTAAAVVHAAGLLSRSYVLVATNPPYLKRSSMAPELKGYLSAAHPRAQGDLATAFIERALQLVSPGGSIAVVSPQNWLLLTTYAALRKNLLGCRTFELVARLGSGAFRQISGEIVKVGLTIISAAPPPADHRLSGLLAHRAEDARAKSEQLRQGRLYRPRQADQAANPDHRITATTISQRQLLAGRARALQGIATADYPRFGRVFWERTLPHCDWEFQQSTVSQTMPYGGREHIVWWQQGKGVLHDLDGVCIRGSKAWGKPGIAVSQMGDLAVTLYTGELFDNNTAVIVPDDSADLAAIWAYCSSSEFHEDVRDIDDALKVTNATLVKVTFDRDRWQRKALDEGALSTPHSDDPTQWLFKGSVRTAAEPLQVAVARLLGYRWPDQLPDALDSSSDADGIVALPALSGELNAATRLRAVLARSYAAEWSTHREQQLVQQACGKRIGLAEWLRDEFFKQHTKVFHQRPFLWHIWDGRKDGFAAIVNYHRLDRRTLEKLAFTLLGSWIDKQRTDVDHDPAGAELRLAAALDLRRRLELILAGESPYDVYIRWKPLAQQPIGWEPDLDDGVRMNIRPFVTAGVLRARVNVGWTKDRGTNPDGSDRHNDLHPSLAERRAARVTAGAT